MALPPYLVPPFVFRATAMSSLQPPRVPGGAALLVRPAAVAPTTAVVPGVRDRMAGIHVPIITLPCRRFSKTARLLASLVKQIHRR